VGYQVSVLPKMEDYTLMAINVHLFNVLITTINIWRESAPSIIWDMSCNADNTGLPHLYPGYLTHCGRVTQICVFNTVKLGTSASSP